MKYTNTLLTAFVVLFAATVCRAQITQTFSYQGDAFQQYIVPASGIYFLDVSGAQGGDASNISHRGGLGARMQGYVQLQAGDTLRISVGRTGGKGTGAANNVSGGGGGGASSVVKVNGTTYTPLIFAAGGGGGAANYNGNPGTASPSGSPSWGGTNGGGGGLGANSSIYGGAGGGGYIGNGQSHYGNNGSTFLSQGGFAYLNGNAGGNSGNNGGDGGWGGGGEGGSATTGAFNNNDGAGGGGGGWSGGGGGSNQGDGGGGGGSYVDATLNTSNCLAVGGANSGNGIVSIEHLVYSNASVDTSFTFQGNVFQYFTVPATGYYQITARGAQGGSVNGNSGGKGAQMQGYVLLHAGQTVKVAAGGAGQNGQYGIPSSGYWPGAGGGGASVVLLQDNSDLLLVAGGGGGAALSGDGDDASLSTSGTTPANGGQGGANGNGGSSDGGAGGGGYLTDGGSPTQCCNSNTDPAAFGGQAYLSGNFGGGGGDQGPAGGWGGGGQGAATNWYSGSITTIKNNYLTNGGAGGGGGYSGGGGGSFSSSGSGLAYGGGGGGSYSAVQCSGANISGVNTGNGSVSISGPNVSIDTVNTPGPAYTWAANGVTYQHSGTYYHVDQANCIVQVLDLSIGGLGGCMNYTRVDTTIVSCGSYTNPLNGRTYTENTTDSIRVGCTKYVVRLITTAPFMLPPGAWVLGTPTTSWGLIYPTGGFVYGNSGSLLSPSSPLVACKNSTETYTIPVVPYATSYQWTLPSGATGTSATNTITVQFSNSFSGGDICVTPVNACGAGTTFCRAITVLNTPPTGPLQITGPTAPFISGNYSVTPIAGATTYTWSVSNNQAVIVSGQGTPNIQLEAQPGFARANLSVVASNCRGNGSRGTLALKAKGNGPGAAAIRMSALETEELSVYPNPSNGQFMLNTPSLQTDATLEVYSSDGRLVFKQHLPANTTQISIGLQQPAAGLYQVRVVAGEEMVSIKIVVN